jgi:hypothetical protein
MALDRTSGPGVAARGTIGLDERLEIPPPEGSPIMTSWARRPESIARWGLSGIGGLLLVIAIFLDPTGASPDSGLVDLGPAGTRWLLGGLGAALFLGSAWGHLKSRGASSR